MTPETRPRPSITPGRLLAPLAGLLVLKVTASVVSNYVRYAPPDFGSDFLHGRDDYFWGPYHWAFYVHIASGPITLAVGLFLVAKASRTRFPTWHRRLGWFQVALVLFAVTPSGLWMAQHAAAGPVAGVGLATQAVATGTTAALGAWTAARRRLADHRRWMWRCYLLLCSAVVLRLMGGLATVVGTAPAWFDPATTWACWLLPLAAFEARERTRRRPVVRPADRLERGRKASVPSTP